MKYVVRKSIVRILGRLWMPNCKASMDRELSSYDVRNASDEEGKITRESVEDWLSKNAGDFSEIIDFEADLEVGTETVRIPWNDEENELVYLDCMFPPEDEGVES